jgi:hypothetical protein
MSRCLSALILLCWIAPAAAHDFDGDLKSDVLWRNASSGENYLYPMDGTTILGTEGYLRTVADQNWKIAGTGDFDGDGKADVLWRNSSTGENYLYFMNGTAIAAEGYLRTVADQNWQVAGVGDFNADGNDDILWRNAVTGENYLYPMDGLAILGAEGFLRTVADANWRIVGTGDFDGDTTADILWRNAGTGENYLYPMDGTLIKPTEGFLRAVTDQSWQVAGVGDFDGDAKADVLWRNLATGENYLYPMDGTTILAGEGYLRAVADQAWQVQATGDYDGDGNADVLWRNSTTGENYLYPMDGTTIKPTEGYLRAVPDLAWNMHPGSRIAAAGPAATAQIAVARAAADGMTSLPITNAPVTYVKPSLGGLDPAGFFVQGERDGPALFVAVDPATLIPAPAAGDGVSFTIVTMGTASGMRRATEISGFVRISHGAPLAGLVQDVSNAVDLSINLDTYESELIRVQGTIAGAFAGAGTGYEQASFDTAGLTGSLLLRLPASLVASLDLVSGCQVTLDRVPLWRLTATAQVSGWEEADIRVDSCPAPNVTGALALSAASVLVEFDRLISASSVLPDASQFVFEGGLTAVGASVSGKTVTLTTGPQSSGAPYTVSVAASVTDTHGAGVNAAANSAPFTGYGATLAGHLVINEVDYDQPGLDTAEFVEIYNPTAEAVSLDGLALVFINGANGTEYERVLLSAEAGASLAPGAYLVVASSGVTVAPGAAVIEFDLASNNIQNGDPDGIALFDTLTGTLIDALSYGGQINAATIDGDAYDLVEGTATSTLDSSSEPGSLIRLPDGADTDDAAADWRFTSTPTPGSANAP